ncbi:MAG: hypothetical protein VYC39_08230 [Myxococcota bacterium]|nr:hypothetical protein [Myxococcota bacterium]
MTDAKTQNIFGIRLLAAVFAEAKTLILFACVFGLFGLFWSVSELNGYTYEATLGSGLLYPGEPVEKPQKTIVKIRAAGLKVINYEPELGNISVSLKPGGHRKNYGPIFDIKILAKTSSQALAMFSSIKETILRDHNRSYAYESAINEAHAGMSSVRAAFLRKQLNSESALLNETNMGLLSASKDVSSAKSLNLRFQTPLTQVLRSDLKPTPVLNRKIAFTMVGLILGFLFGAVFVMLRSLISNEEDSEDKALLESFTTFLSGHRYAVYTGLALGLILAGLVFLKTGNKTVSSSVLQVANVAPYGPFSEIQSIQLLFTDKMERLNSEICQDKCKVEVLTVRTRPSPYAPSDIVEIRATGSSATATQEIVTRTAEIFLHLQAEEYKKAIEMQQQRIQQLEADLNRLVESDATKIDQSVTVGFIRDITKSKRYLNPTRSYPAEVLMPTFSVKQSSSKYLLVLLLGGIVCGLLIGLVIGLLQAALREARGAL